MCLTPLLLPVPQPSRCCRNIRWMASFPPSRTSFTEGGDEGTDAVIRVRVGNSAGGKLYSRKFAPSTCKTRSIIANAPRASAKLSSGERLPSLSRYGRVRGCWKCTVEEAKLLRLPKSPLISKWDGFGARGPVVIRARDHATFPTGTFLGI